MNTILRCYIVALLLLKCHSFTLNMMGARRGKGSLKKSLSSSPSSSSKTKKKNVNSNRSLNKGKGQELLGVTLPDEGKMKGWEFGKNTRIACANVNGRYYAIQGDCPRCAFDLYKGTIVDDEKAFGPDVPVVACPTCSTTFSLRTGKRGPTYKRTGLQAFVGNLAQTATMSDAAKDARAFVITTDDEGKVYCRDL